MSLSSGPLVLVGAIVTAGLSLFLALQLAALLLPFVLSGLYKWMLVAISIVLVAVSGFLRARKRRKASFQQRYTDSIIDKFFNASN